MKGVNTLTEPVSVNLASTNIRQLIREIRNYLAGRALGFTRDESLLEEVLKVVFAFVQIKLYAPDLYAQLKDSAPEQLSKIYRKGFRYVVKKYPEIFGEDEQLLLSPQDITYIHEKLADIPWIEEGHDIVRDIYEVFLGAQYRGQEGQFFTPEVAVETLVELVEPSLEDTILDPACGTGSFLVAVAKRFAKSSWGKAESTPSFCAVDKDKYLARLAKVHLSLLLGKSVPVYTLDSLVLNGGIQSACGTEAFSLVLTNPPFGSRISAADEELKKQYKLAYRWRYDKRLGRYVKTEKLLKNVPPQVLFLERILSLLRAGGRAGVVLPESLLSSPKYSYVVQFILDNAQPTAVIGMPEELFKTSGKGGTHTKTVLLVLQKGKYDPNAPIFMAEARWCGHDSRGRPIPRNDLPLILEKYKKYKRGGALNSDRLGFLISGRELKNYVLAPKLYSGFLAIHQKRRNQHAIRIGDLAERGLLHIAKGDEVGKLAYGTGDIPFVRTSDISNWEIKVDPKHTVNEEIYLRLAKKQDVREGDILMVKDGTYLIGAVAYITKLDTRIVYQSHLYKLRLAENDLFDRFYLLAILSAPFVQSQIKALSYTQDIINSLGNRIYDIWLPLPTSRAHMLKVSQTVKRSIELRVQARILAEKARKMAYYDYSSPALL